jgi:DNA-binding transcriptional ArsR family regulator
MDKVFKALSDPTRRHILQLLSVQPLTAGALAQHFNIAKATLSAHFGVLREADLIDMEKVGTSITYRLKLSVLDDALLAFTDTLRNNTPLSTNSVWDQRRAEISRWLETNARPLAGLYKSTTAFLDSKPFGGRSRFIAHGAREIANRLPDYIAGVISGHTPYDKLVAEILPSWREAGLPVGDDPLPTAFAGSPQETDSGLHVPGVVVKKIANLLGKHEDVAARNTRKAERLFDALNKEAGGSSRIPQPTLSLWRETCDWFGGQCHLPNGDSSVEIEIPEDELRRRWKHFEGMLHAMAAEFFSIVDGMDADLAKEPTAENVAEVIARFSRAAISRYFFERQNNPDWLQPLDAAGCFKNPPSIVIDEARSIITAPPWPATAFLVRMAPLKSELVADIVCNMPETSNPTVNGHIVDIALGLPPALAKGVSKRLLRVIGHDHISLVVRLSVPKLIVHLAKGQEPKAALSLAKAFFAVSPPKSSSLSSGGPAERLSGLRTSEDLWSYREGIKTSLPALLNADAKGTIRLLCSLLIDAAKASGLYQKVPAYDYSLSLAGAIGQLDDNMSLAAVGRLLAAAVADAAVRAVCSEKIDAAEAVRGFGRYPRAIFDAIALHVLAEIKPLAVELAAERMTDRSQFDQATSGDMYGQLLNSRFGELSPERRQQIIGWIMEGPGNEEAHADRYARFYGQPPTAQQIDIHKKAWMRVRLKWLPTGMLPVKQAKLLREIEDVLKPLEAASPFSYFQSPKTLAELRTMSVGEIASFLKSWETSCESAQSTVGAVATELFTVVKERSSEFSAAAECFIGVHQTYLRLLLQGLGDAARQSASIHWEPVVSLCAWVVGQPRGEETQDGVRFEEVSWKGARSSVADLLRDGFQNQKHGIPGTCRADVWSILEELAADPDPSSEYEPHSNDGPAEHSFNSVRGKAMHAVISYAWWTRRLLDAAALPAEGGFNAMPEVRKLLNAHLEVAREPSLAVRSVYGHYFPWLVHLDSAWAAASSDLIFPEDEESRPLWQAAWTTYERFAGAYDNVFAILRQKYSLAVRRFSEERRSPRTSDMQQNLGAHLMAFYWRGKIDLSADNLVTQFMERAHADMRQTTLEFVGRSLINEKGAIPPDVLMRLETLWEARVRVAKESGKPETFREDLASFGLWFSSGRFEVDWSLRTLKTVLDLTGKIGFAYQVIARLAILAPDRPRQVVHCLHEIIRAERDYWPHMYAHEQTAAILDIGLSSPDRDVAAMAAETINIIGERGDWSFQPLLAQRSRSASRSRQPAET